MLSEAEQRIYNNHLIISRKIRGEPFTKRKNFDKMDENVINNVKKLDEFFKNHPNIDMDTFFTAPYMIYGDLYSYYSLEFFTSYPAITCYAQYMKKLEMDNPDNDEVLSRLKKTLKFVYNFCKEHGQTFDSYPEYTLESLPCFVEHLKTHKINFYTLHALTFSKPKVESKILEFVIPDFFLTFQKTKNKFFTSNKMREFSRVAREKLNEKLKLCLN